MQVLDKDTIKDEIEIYLSKGKRGFKPQVAIYQIVQLIVYKLKTGCQWSLIPIKEFIPKGNYSYSSVYHHYRKWTQDGSWESVWINVLKNNKNLLNLSSIQIDGSHTPAKKGGENVAYQGRKRCKTSNMIFLCDKAGNMLSFSKVHSGNHNDLYKIEDNLSDMLETLRSADIQTKGLFCNADTGFDSNKLKRMCHSKEVFFNVDINKRNSQDVDNQEYYFIFDKKLYRDRFVIERANAWIDSFRTLLVRFTIKTENWIALHYIALTIRLLKKKFK